MKAEQDQFELWCRMGYSPERLLEGYAGRHNLPEPDQKEILLLFRYLTWLKDIECSDKILEALRT